MRTKKHHIDAGHRFGKLLVIGPAPKKNDKIALTCRCACGKRVEVVVYNLISGNTRSCGCGKKSTRTSRHMKIFMDLHYPKVKKWESNRSVRGLRGVACPRCKNSNMEHICKLRNDFYECEACGYLFDKDIK